MSETNYYQKNREMILNRAKRYYHDNIEVLSKKARNKYSRLPELEKSRNIEYGRNKYHRKLEESREENQKMMQELACISSIITVERVCTFLKQTKIQLINTIHYY